MVYGLDGVLRLGTLRRQPPDPGLLAPSIRDRRSVLGWPTPSGPWWRTGRDAPVFYLTALPINYAGPVTRLLERKGYPPGRVLIGGSGMGAVVLSGASLACRVHHGQHDPLRTTGRAHVAPAYTPTAFRGRSGYQP